MLRLQPRIRPDCRFRAGASGNLQAGRWLYVSRGNLNRRLLVQYGKQCRAQRSCEQQKRLCLRHLALSR
jgi:hypothetical protein